MTTGFSAWQGITGLRQYPDLLHEVLDGVIDGSIKPTTMKQRCEQQKKIGATRDMICVAMKQQSWTETLQKYPCFAVKDNMEQLLKAGKSGGSWHSFELVCTLT